MNEALSAVSDTEMEGRRKEERKMVGYQEVGWVDSGDLSGFQGTVILLLWHQDFITGVEGRGEESPQVRG